MSDSNRTAFKDYFDGDAARRLGHQLASTTPEIDVDAFVAAATDGLESREFAARIRHFAATMRGVLPDDAGDALDRLRESLPEELPDAEAVTDGWLQWPIGQFVADYGLDHVDQSFALMEELTKRLTSEFAIRPFVRDLPDETFRRLTALVASPDEHVRRWCSEGVRPRLPWGEVLRDLVADPTPILPILEALRDDPSEYVRRSVANNLNDISKDHPGVAVDIARRWASDATPERTRLIRHALRTRITAGDPDALAVVGFHPPEHISASVIADPPNVRVGDATELAVSLTNTGNSAARLMVDIVVHYVRQRGTSEKVFKGKTVTIDAGTTDTVHKRVRSPRPRSERCTRAGTASRCRSTANDWPRQPSNSTPTESRVHSRHVATPARLLPMRRRWHVVVPPTRAR